MIQIGGDDRVLVLGPTADLADTVECAGLVVVALDREAIYDARATYRDRPNVMVVPAEDDGTIPWQDGFFSVVHAPAAEEPTAEMLRVLAPGGAVLLAAGAVVRR